MILNLILNSIVANDAFAAVSQVAQSNGNMADRALASDLLAGVLFGVHEKSIARSEKPVKENRIGCVVFILHVPSDLLGFGVEIALPALSAFCPHAAGACSPGLAHDCPVCLTISHALQHRHTRHYNRPRCVPGAPQE